MERKAKQEAQCGWHIVYICEEAVEILWYIKPEKSFGVILAKVFHVTPRYFNASVIMQNYLTKIRNIKRIVYGKRP